MLDLVVIGGGPAGLLTAARCAEAGLNVVVLEEHAEVGAPPHCTGIVSLEVTAYAKVPDELILKKLTRARFSVPGEPPYELAWDPPANDQILAIDRAAFDRSLAGEARKAGAVVETATHVTGVAAERHGVTVAAQDGRRFEAKACVLACGVTYKFQRALGLGLPRQVRHTAQVEVEAPAGDMVELWFGRNVAPAGFLWVVPLTRPDGHRAKIGTMVRGDAGAFLQRFLAGPGARHGEMVPPAEMHRRLLPLETLARTYADRVLVVGDAGGFTKPTTGGGIFYSLLTASLAAETLVDAFHAGRLDAPFLARYQRRWEAVLGQELRVGRWLRQVLTKATDREVALVLKAVVEDDVQALVRRTARFNWHRELIVTLARHPRIAALLVRLLLR